MAVMHPMEFTDLRGEVDDGETSGRGVESHEVDDGEEKLNLRRNYPGKR